MVTVLKKALAQTLVSYYALAGELVQNVDGEPELLCNNRGVDFVEAFANIELQDLNLYNPDESIEGKLVPRKKQGLLAIQVTTYKNLQTLKASSNLECFVEHSLQVLPWTAEARNPKSSEKVYDAFIT